MRKKTTWLVRVTLLSTVGLAACGLDFSSLLPASIDGTPTKKGTRITQIRGALGPDIGVKGVRLAMLVTDPKKGADGKLRVTQHVATVKGDGSFSFGRLPPGPKSVMVQAGGKNHTLRFPKSKTETDKGTSVIPDATPPAAVGATTQQAPGVAAHSEELSGGLDLGSLKLGKHGMELADPAKNPLEHIDTDGDGKPDFEDDDIDGDGIPNAQDKSPWSNPANGPDPAYDGWGWAADMPPLFDEDGDGQPNWEDPTYKGARGWCNPNDASCTQAFLCAQEPESCTNGQLPAGDPDFCVAFPTDSKCKGTDFCKLVPTAPECTDPAFCTSHPDAAECVCAKNALSCKPVDSSQPVDACILDATSTACVCEHDPKNALCGDICASDSHGLACFCQTHPEDLDCVCAKDEKAAGCTCKLRPESIDCKCEHDPKAPVCACQANPNAAGCNCTTDAAAPGCACALGPSSAECACEQTPGGMACHCLQSPSDTGCACVIDAKSKACGCEKDPNATGCNDPCVKDDTSFACTCFQSPMTEGCSGAGGAGGSGGSGGSAGAGGSDAGAGGTGGSM